MSDTDIKVVKASISLSVGDLIEGNGGTRYEVFAVDYDNSVIGISENGNNYIITFATAECGDYNKIVE